MNPLDISDNAFITSGEAWLKCRKGEYDPSKFGIYGDPKQYGLESLHGLWFIRGNLLRDLASLNKVETIPLLNRLGFGYSWCSWRLLFVNDNEITKEDLQLLDVIAELTIDVDRNFPKLLELYKTNKSLQVPSEILKDS